MLLKLTKRAQQSQTIHGASPTYHKKLIILEIYQVNIKVVMKLCSKIFWFYCFWVITTGFWVFGYLVTIIDIFIKNQSSINKEKNERSQDLQKISLPALEFAILKHRAWSKQVQDQTPLEFFWQFLNESSVLFCILLVHASKSMKVRSRFLLYYYKKKLDLLQQRPAGTIFKCLRTFFLQSKAQITSERKVHRIKEVQFITSSDHPVS